MPHRRIAPPRGPEFEKNRIGKRPRLTETRIYGVAEGMAAPDGSPLLPHLYLWKSAKWVRGITLLQRIDLVFGKNSDTTITVTHGGNSATCAINVARPK